MLLFARLASLLALFARSPVKAAAPETQVGSQVELTNQVEEGRQVRARTKKGLRKSESLSELESQWHRRWQTRRGLEKSQEQVDDKVEVASCSAQVSRVNLKSPIALTCDSTEARQLEDLTSSNLNRAEEVQQQLDQAQHAHQSAIDLHSVCGQLLTLICALLLLLYTIDFVHRQMANLFNKLLGSGSGSSNQQQDQRRRSLAAGSSGSNSSQQQQRHSQQTAPLVGGRINKSSSSRSIAQPQSAQQQQKSQTLQSQAPSASRRSSRSSIHSLFNALIGGSGSGSGGGQNAPNGRSIIAKNKEDTVIASSPTIIQKEGSESSASGGGQTAGGAVSPGATAASSTAGPTTPGGGGGGGGVTPGASPQVNGPQLMSQAAAAAAAASSVAGSPLASILGVSQAIGAQQMRTGGGGGGDVAELVLADQFLYDTARNPLNSITNVFALAAAAATETPGSVSSSGIAGTGAIMPSVATQLARNELELVGGGRPGQQQAGQPQHPTHGQLSSSGTIKSAGGGPGSPVGSQAGGAQSSPRASISSGPLATMQAMRRHEIITHTELLLNALNQGDYDTYTRLCDPHMTSFEPENCGHLIDNMELRRLAVDQARQLQIHHHLATFSGQQQHQPGQAAIASAVAVAAASAAAAAAGAASAVAPAPSNTSSAQNSTTSSGVSSVAGQRESGEQQRIQQIALVATQAALASLNLSGPTHLQTSSSCASQKFYSLMVNPQVCLLGDDGATIAYTKLSHLIDLASGQVVRVEQSEETRVWHRRNTGGNAEPSSQTNKRSWVCVHLHRSLVTSNNYNNDCHNHQMMSSGPLTSLALLRAIGQQQRLAQVAHVQQQNVPSISLNNTGQQQQPR